MAAPVMPTAPGDEPCLSDPDGCASFVHVGLNGFCNHAVRAVATPCRSVHTCRDVSPCVADDDGTALSTLITSLLPTLAAPLTTLESGCWLFALPSSIVSEAPSCGHKADTVSTTQESFPCPIILQDLCPITDFQRSTLELQALLPATPGNAESGDDWLDAERHAILQSPYLARDLAFRFAQVRTVWQVCPSDAPVALHVYTDGSSGGGLAEGYAVDCAWAFSVWAVYHDQELLVGHAAHTSVPPGTRFHLGEMDSTPLTAERLALMWAFCWVIEIGAGHGLPIVMCYDCTAAGDVAFGHARSYCTASTQQDGSLAEALCVLRQCAGVPANIIPRHVRSHVGVLQNEWSDQLAKQARRQVEHVDARVLPLWPARLVQHPLRLQAAPPPALPRDCAAPPEDAEEVLHLTFVSYNALTLRDPKPVAHHAESHPVHVGVKLSGRRELLKVQFARLGVQFVGLQETRTAEDAIQPDADFWMLHTACDANGSFGTALWISKTVPYGRCGCTQLHVELHHLAVVAKAPRFLLVRVDAPYLDLLVVVGHVPHETSKDTCATTYWQQVAQHFSFLPSSTQIVMLIDGNAHVGSEVTHAVGHVWPEPENLPGRVLHDVLLQWGLCAPSTFPANHSGDSATWHSAGGVPHRLDYVIILGCWRAGAASFVLTDFEALQGRQDHLPDLVQCSLQHARARKSYRSAPARRAIRPEAAVTKG